jgi:hypothetical protein
MTPGVQSQFVATQSQGSSSIESQEMTIAIRMTRGFFGVGEFEIVTGWKQSSDAFINIVASESVEKVTIQWERKTDMIKLMPVTKVLAVYEHDLIYGAFEDINDFITSGFFQIGYVESEYTISSSDANIVMISVNGISIADQSNSLGRLEWNWLFNSLTNVMPALHAKTHFSGRVEFTLTAVLVHPNPGYRPILVTLAYVVNVQRVADAPEVVVHTPSNVISYGFAAAFDVSCTSQYPNFSETYDLSITMSAEDCNAVSMVYMLDLLVVREINDHGCSFKLHDNQALSQASDTHSANFFVRVNQAFFGEMTMYFICKARYMSSVSESMKAIELVWEPNMAPVVLPVTYLWLSAFEDELTMNNWSHDIQSVVATFELGSYNVSTVEVSCDMMNSGVDSLLIDNVWLACGTHKVSDIGQLAV